MNKLPPLEYLPASAQPAPIKPNSNNNSQKEAAAGVYIDPPGNTAAPGIQEDFYAEITRKQDHAEKMKRAIKSNPFVPIGALITVGILANGMFAMKNKNAAKSQRMMRYRVAAQGATVLALMGGTFLTQLFYQPADD